MQFPKRLVVLTLGFAALDAAAQTYSIDGHILSTGSSTTSGSTCFRLQATTAEPVAGYSSGATYSISAGFRASVPNAGDEVFFSGFETCP